MTKSKGNKGGGSRPHICPDCGKNFSKSSNYYRHLQTHEEVQNLKFRCHWPGCEARPVRTAHNLKTHVDSVHLKIRSDNCPFCGKDFSAASGLIAHIKRHKDDEMTPSIDDTEESERPKKKRKTKASASLNEPSEILFQQWTPDHVGESSASGSRAFSHSSVSPSESALSSLPSRGPNKRSHAPRQPSKLGTKHSSASSSASTSTSASSPPIASTSTLPPPPQSKGRSTKPRYILPKTAEENTHPQNATIPASPIVRHATLPIPRSHPAESRFIAFKIDEKGALNEIQSDRFVSPAASSSSSGSYPPLQGATQQEPRETIDAFSQSHRGPPQPELYYRSSSRSALLHLPPSESRVHEEDDLAFPQPFPFQPPSANHSRSSSMSSNVSFMMQPPQLVSQPTLPVVNEFGDYVPSPTSSQILLSHRRSSSRSSGFASSPLWNTLALSDAPIANMNTGSSSSHRRSNSGSSGFTPSPLSNAISLPELPNLNIGSNVSHRRTTSRSSGLAPTPLSVSISLPELMSVNHGSDSQPNLDIGLDAPVPQDLSLLEIVPPTDAFDEYLILPQPPLDNNQPLFTS